MRFPREQPRELRTVTVTMQLPGPWNEHRTRVTMLGENPFRKDPLWRYSEDWSFSEQQQGLEPCDAAHYLLLAARQDRPNTQEGLTRALQGLPPWEQLSLFPEG